MTDEKKSRTVASLRGRIGAYTRWARTEDRVAATDPARRAFWARFEIEVDPNGELPVAERQRRAQAARKAYFARLALRSVQVRAKKRRR